MSPWAKYGQKDVTDVGGQSTAAGIHATSEDVSLCALDVG